MKFKLYNYTVNKSFFTQFLQLIQSDELIPKQTNITNPKPQARKVHLIRRIGVALIESDYELTNGNTNLNLGIQFPNEFFTNVGVKNECNKTGEATKAIIKAGQDLYLQLIDQLQNKIYGNKAARVERKRDIEATSSEINDYSYASNEYEDLHHANNVYEYEDLHFTRVKNFVIAKSINRTTIIQSEDNIVNPLFKNKTIIVTGEQTVIIFPISYVDHIKWSEFAPTNKTYATIIEIKCLKYTCAPTCD